MWTKLTFSKTMSQIGTRVLLHFTGRRDRPNHSISSSYLQIPSPSYLISSLDHLSFDVAPYYPLVKPIAIVCPHIIRASWCLAATGLLFLIPAPAHNLFWQHDRQGELANYKQHKKWFHFGKIRLNHHTLKQRLIYSELSFILFKLINCFVKYE